MKMKRKKISTKPGVAFNGEMFDKRFDYVKDINQVQDEKLWFIDESGFNLHIAPLRCLERR